MPLPSGGRYRMKGKTRLHFNKRGVVDEAKNMQTGSTHTPAEFAVDRRRKPAPSRASVAGYRTRGTR